MIVAFILSVIVCLGALYLIWRVKYRYPPANISQVLCYHKISRHFLFEGTWTTPNRFFTQIDRLTGEGYKFIDEDAYLAGLERWLDDAPGRPARPHPAAPDNRAGHSGDHPDKQLFLTFDDGYSQIFSLVFPRLADQGISAHIFLVTDYVGRENHWDLSLGRPPSRHFDWPEVKEMAEHGFTFGSHGASHRDLTRLSKAACSDELRRSRSAIEDRLGRPVRSFSYPFGRYNRRLTGLVRSAGYEAAFSLYPAHSNERLDRFALRRNGIYVIDSPRTIKLKLQRHPLSWFEEMKCRTINATAALTPLFKSLSGSRDN